jgi:hypothetical protein
MSEMTALQRLEQKLMQGGAALPVPIDANGVENGLSIALLLVREEMAALAAAPAAAPRQPLTRQQIDDLMTEHFPLDSLLTENVDRIEAFVRDAEKLHGIGGAPAPATGEQQ